MKVITWGTRGSLPVAGNSFVRYGGNTTCVEIRSECLPADLAFVIDAGTGFLPFSLDALGRKVRRIVVPHTHYHHDHTQGMMIAPPIFIDGVELSILGPMENGWGPKEVYERLMTPPLHPMSIKKVIHHLTFQGMEEPSTKVIVVHPAEGMRVIDLPVFRRAVDKGKHINFRAGVNYPVEECLVVTMHWSQHPERTIAYRIEERPTGRVFVFLTDEEVRAEIPGTLQTFLKGAHLLIEDAQYLEEVYRTRTAGYGHGTPGYAVRLALMGGIPHLGLIHHDPTSSDDDIDALVAEGQLAADGQLTVFACADRQEIEV